ncbi:hypothetical protein D7Y13_08855 [Corallococcus praedator]|uniref:PEGA domain-containing protein n=1 Tax=Corallococcus praedator TaxID=2316724 RepID=A0ABX9QMK0_9BACT|nr:MULTISPECIES: hypothetical protein [Corallococcus]RKH21051.1 hypothetical protein D7X74_02260 [Corallococcus sp. CA047B]RKH33111.1 hypothetical protein D7X75_13240 [Corallococcus sp. CA031C]RKI12749.1 hypothetical protein D7Y13_08855 [Corallococcus praedator]
MFVLAAILAVPGIARAQIVVGLYPVQGKIEPGVRADAEGLIASGVRASNRRQGSLVLRGPVPLKASCEPKPTTECLAGLARGGAIIYAEATVVDGVASVSMSAITERQHRTAPVKFRFIPGFLDLRPVHYAVEQLEKALTEPTSQPVAEDAAQGVASAEPAPAPDIRPEPPPVASAAPAEVEPLAEQDPVSLHDKARPTSSGWMRKTGIYASIGGALVAGAGGVFGLRSKSLNKDLSQRYNDGRLVPADRAKYDQAKTSSTLANTLMIGGGVVALTGLTLWGLSGVSFDSDGDGGGNVYVRGRW